MEVEKQGMISTTSNDEVLPDATDEINLNRYIVETSAEEDAAIEMRKEKIRGEIAELEDDIKTLKQAVARKEAHLGELKKELGVTRWSQFREGLGQKYQAYQSTQVYNKLSAASTTTKQSLGVAGEKTSAALKSFGSATAKKWQDIRESPTFHTMEEKMWATTGAIKESVVKQTDGASNSTEQPPQYYTDVISQAKFSGQKSDTAITEPNGSAETTKETPSVI